MEILITEDGKVIFVYWLFTFLLCIIKHCVVNVQKQVSFTSLTAGITSNTSAIHRY